MGELALFMDESALRRCAAAFQDGNDPATSDLRQLLGTAIGGAIFAGNRMKLLATEYIATVKQGLCDLENLDRNVYLSKLFAGRKPRS